MFNLLKAELYKLFYSRYFWAILVFHFILSSIFLLDSKHSTVNLFFASLYNTPYLFFLIIVFAALYVGDDLGSRTLYTDIAAGHKKWQVVFAKAIIYQSACIVILTLPLGIHGWIGKYVMAEPFSAIEGTAVTFALIICSILAMCSLPFFLAFFLRDMGKTLAVSMVLFFIMIFLMNGDETFHITKRLPMGQLRLISLQQLPMADLSFAVIDGLWMIILYTASVFVFCNTDLK